MHRYLWVGFPELLSFCVLLCGNTSYVMGLNPIVLFLQDEHSFTSYFGRGFRMPGLTDSMDATG